MVATVPFVGLFNNAALLLVFGIIYGALQRQSDSWQWRIVRGVMLGVIAIAVMSNPWQLAPGMIFDTRTIVLSVGGMFLGFVPTAIATAMAGLFRLYLGGVGAFTGCLWILVSGASGLLWLHFRGGEAYQLKDRDFYLLGLILHAVLLLLMFTMPNNLAFPILKNITLPVLLIYPIVSVLLARLIAAQKVQEINKIALNRSERKYRELVQNSRVVVLRADSEGLITFLNRYGQEFFGFSSEDIVGKHMVGTIIPETNGAGEDQRAMIDAVLAAPEQYPENENENICRDGRRVQVLWKNMPVNDAAGEQIGIQSIGHDMTELRRAEEVLRAREQQLQQLMRITPVPLIIIDREQRAININRSFTDTYGYDITDIPSAKAWWLRSCPDDDYREQVEQRWNRAVEKMFRDGGPFEPQHAKVCCKDGSVRDAVGLFASIGDHGVVVLNDMTRVRELDRMKSEFISTAAHELRTPLTSIRGYAELMKMSADPRNEEEEEFLSIILEKSEALEHIIDDLLSVGKVESGLEIHLNRSKCSIEPLLERLVDTYQRQYGGRTFNLQWYTDKTIEILFDEGKVEQVLQNLLSNAIKFSRPAQPIWIKVFATNDKLHIAIRDEGIGMNTQQIDHVFDKFYRVDSSNTSAPGMGLGMGIAKGIVEAHGGSIWIESESNAGSTVTFSLPLTGCQRSDSDHSIRSQRTGAQHPIHERHH